MRTTMRPQRLLILAALLGSATVAFEASAQTEGDLQIRFYSSPGYGGEGMPYRDCSAPTADGSDADAEQPVDEISTGPLRREETEAGSALSPEEAMAYRDQRRSVLLDLIRQYDQMLGSLPPNATQRADILFRKAEALRELADADYLVGRATFNECINAWYQCTSDGECYEPMADYVEAIASYSEISRNHGQYNRIDEVIFRLGETLVENDDASTGVQYLSRLVANYPASIFLPDAHLMMGEHYFEQDVLSIARAEYDAVLAFPDSSIYNYAIYKLGWVDINEDYFEEALTRFQTVVANLDANPGDTLDFRNQAMNDMLLAYVDLENGWQRAREYYESIEGEEFMRRKLSQLANLYDDRGLDDSRVAVLGYFLDRYPSDPMVPQWMADTLDSLEKIGQWDAYESAARSFIAMLDPTGSWALQNQSNTQQLRNARSFGEEWLLSIIIRNDSEARRLSDPTVKRDLFTEVAADYSEFFERFGDSEEAYEQRFQYAETLYYQIANQGDCGGHYFDQASCDLYMQQAGDQYLGVVEMRPDPAAEHAHDSAVAALQIYDEFMTRTNPNVDNPLPAPGDYGQFFGDPQQLNTEGQSYVDIVGWFAELYPEDELIPAASWRAASLYLYASQVEEAAQRFETIVEFHPNHRFAQNAALGAFVCYSHVENWVKIESVARRLLEACAGDSDICNREGLTGALAFAMNNQAVDLMEEGQQLRIAGDEAGANERFIAAAEKQVALYDEFPDSEWSPLALNNAASTYEEARQIRRSVELYNEFLTAYPEHELVADVKYTLGLIHESQAEFSEAVAWFDQVDAFPAYEFRKESVLKAARLYEAMSNFDLAVARYEHYLTLDADSETSKEIYFQIAGLEQDRGNIEASYARLQSFRDSYGSGDVARALVATYMQAEIRREQGQMEEALRLYGEVSNQYGRGVMAFDESNAPTGWTTEPGGNVSDPEMRVGLLPYAAEALFWQANVLYETARVSNLEYRAGRIQELIDKLIARGEALAAAERAMFEVFRFGDAEWAVAAATRLGQLYKDFDSDLYRVPAPDYDECLAMTGDNYDACDAQDEQFNEQLAMYGETLQAKAGERWEAGRVIALEQRVFTEFTREMIVSLNEMDRSFTLGGAEGVRATSTADPFFSTRYILDLSSKEQAFEGFVIPTSGPVDAFGNPIVVPGEVPVEGVVSPEAAPAATPAP